MPYHTAALAGRYARKTILKAGLTAAGGLAADLMFAPHYWSGVQAAGAATAPRQASTGTTAGLGALTAANLDFALRLQSTLLKSAAGENLFFSPLSISTALAMIFAGSAGTTQKAMAATLAYKSLSPKDVNATSFSLLTSLQKRDTTVKLSIADSIWVRMGVVVVPAFTAALRSSYNATLQALDFKSPQAPVTINAWVKQQTHGLIPSIVQSIDADTMLFLINALYFKGTWSSPFNQMSTQPAPFTTASGKQKTVPMMSQTGSFGHIRSATAEIIRLPYGAGSFAMYIVLPPAGTTLSAFVSRLTPSAWSALVASLTPQHGSIQMPRFSATYAAGLKPALSTMGMAQAFDPESAAFPGILVKQRAFISEIKHRAVMHVDESGTEAAAVTSIGVGATAVIEPMFNMVVNRPFVCAIRDDATGTLLFTGAIADPS